MKSAEGDADQGAGRRPDEDLLDLLSRAAKKRDQAWGRVVTFSPKVFLPLTNLCRNRCDYCSFRRSQSQAGAWTMSPEQVEEALVLGRQRGCIEALFCLGDTPESSFPSYRNELLRWGFSSTVDYIEWGCKKALSLGLLPHTNAGILSAGDMVRLRRVNVSLGLMLESVSDRLCERGMPHHRAPDKRPQTRLRMISEAGELKIPFTTGLLVGIGETEKERLDTILAIRELHARHGHIQEVIVQGFRAKPDIPMAHAPEAADVEVAECIAWTRLLLPSEISVQAPPNLHPASTKLLIEAGVNDLGGISPVTPDYINPGHPWPQLAALTRACANSGMRLQSRLAIYPAYLTRPGFLDEALLPHVSGALPRLGSFNREALAVAHPV